METNAWENRKLWGIQFVDKTANREFLIGGGWHPEMMRDRYKGEPARAVLFTTRKAAQEWCKEKNSAMCCQAKLRVVRVIESVTLS